MHFPIIQLSTEPLSPEEFASEEYYYDDVIVEANSDYISGVMEKERRKEFIRERLPEILEGLAIVNADNETVTVLPEKDIRHSLRDALRHVLDSFEQRFREGRLSHDDVRIDAKEYNGHNALFTINGSGAYTASAFAETLACYDDRTLHVGSVVWAHY